MKKTYIDANIFLNAILYDDEKSNICKQILTQIITKEIQGFTSLLTWDEVVYGVKKLRGQEIAIKEGNKFLKMPNLNFLNIGKEVIIKSQELINAYNIDPRDSIHLSSMLINDIQELASDDSDFDKIKEIKRIKL